jgi:hypothetical protein
MSPMGAARTRGKPSTRLRQFQPESANPVAYRFSRTIRRVTAGIWYRSPDPLPIATGRFRKAGESTALTIPQVAEAGNYRTTVAATRRLCRHLVADAEYSERSCWRACSKSRPDQTRGMINRRSSRVLAPSGGDSQHCSFRGGAAPPG